MTTERSDGHRHLSAWRDPRANLRFWIVAGLGLAVDLWSKGWAFRTLNPGENRSILSGVLEFRRSLNPGAVFGLGAGLVTVFIAASALALMFVLFLFIGSSKRHRALHVALGMILAGALGNLYDRTFVKAEVVRWRTAAGDLRTDVGVVRSDVREGLIGLGTWPDGSDPRLIPATSVLDIRTQGVVRDFIHIIPEFPSWVPIAGGRGVWPWIFNVADSLLVCGVLLLMGHLWRTGEPARAGRTGRAGGQAAANPPSHETAGRGEASAAEARGDAVGDIRS
ncbi:MAG: Lipoprotein signal peptidase [Phycisphaerae bacterium]|nr:Lipoprotein signal peptidase [Phycisphaerae bacterium]